MEPPDTPERKSRRSSSDTGPDRDGTERLFEAGQDAEGKSRRPRAAAGKRQRHDHVVVIVGNIGRKRRGHRGRIGGKRLIDRIVVDDGGAACHEGGTGNDAPRADSTLVQSPNHLQKVKTSPPCPSSNAEMPQRFTGGSG